MSEKKKKEGKLLGLFENMNFSVSSVSRPMMSGHAGPVSPPSLRTQSPESRNEMTTLYGKLFSALNLYHGGGLEVGSHFASLQ
jgi:hypothetical protein